MDSAAYHTPVAGVRTAVRLSTQVVVIHVSEGFVSQIFQLQIGDSAGRAVPLSYRWLDTYNPWIYLGVRTGLLQSGTLCPSRGAGDNSGGGGGGRGSGVNQRSGAEPRPASCSYYIQAANVRES